MISEVRSRHRPKQPEAPGARHAEPARDAPATPARSVFGGAVPQQTEFVPEMLEIHVIDPLPVVELPHEQCRTSPCRAFAGQERG